MTSPIVVVYSTTSPFKKAEIGEICKSVVITLPRGDRALVGDVFKFDFRDGRPIEPLERDLQEMVRHKVVSAYKNLLIPCIAEHAGLIFEDHKDENFPGGLTQPMWDALGAERFISEISGRGRRVIARAVIGYCDGLNVTCFSGETYGKIADRPAGDREFYWDTIFIPESEAMTYAEISTEPSLGLKRKVDISQSTKALTNFLTYRLKVGAPPLFP